MKIILQMFFFSIFNCFVIHIMHMLKCHTRFLYSVLSNRPITTWKLTSIQIHKILQVFLKYWIQTCKNCLILQSSFQNSSEQSGCSLVCKWKLKLIRYRDELMTKVGFIFRTLPFVPDWIHYLAFMVLKSNDWGTPHLIKRYVLPNEL